MRPTQICERCHRRFQQPLYPLAFGGDSKCARCTYNAGTRPGLNAYAMSLRAKRAVEHRLAAHSAARDGGAE